MDMQKNPECHHLEKVHSQDMEKNTQNILVTATEQSRVRRKVRTILDYYASSADLASSTVVSCPSFVSSTCSPTWTEVCHPLQPTLVLNTEYAAGNIGNAKTAGLQSDLRLSSSEWAWVPNSFYLCYILFEWTTVLWKIFPAHIYVASLCIL
jgi:hypothetical protein